MRGQFVRSIEPLRFAVFLASMVINEGQLERVSIPRRVVTLVESTSPIFNVSSRLLEICKFVVVVSSILNWERSPMERR